MFNTVPQLLSYLLDGIEKDSKFLKKVLCSPIQKKAIKKLLNTEKPGEEIYKLLNPEVSHICGCGDSKNFVNTIIGYRLFCGNKKCEYMNAHKKLAMNDTFFKKYGCHPMATKETQTKYKKALIEKYGVDNTTQISIQKGTYKNHLSTEIVKIKIKETYLLKYGGHPMQNAESFCNNLKSRVKFKKYILPSGKEINLQGYEDKGIQYLLSIYTEDDILTSVKDINDKLGIIRYQDDNGKEHRYYPDFYTISTNTIYEVKSGWTYNANKRENELKRDRCVELGFSFEFLLF